MSDPVLEIDGHRIEISHADKVLFPDDGITKKDLVDFYLRIGETALPYYRDRPLSMHRYPDGIDEDGFFQKSVPDYFPDWIDRATLPKKDGEVTYAIAGNVATLVYLANQGCITPHLALARADKPDKPDRLIFDLDPSDDDFGKVQRAAGHVKDLLDKLDLPAFVQTTGSRGLHIVIPLDRSAAFDDVREFSHRLCRRLAGEHPDLLTNEQRKNKRGKRVFLDDLRNAYGQTSVAPYGVRARPGAPVATPLQWQEVGDARLHPRKYTISNLFRRLGQREDPWAGMQKHQCGLERARRAFEKLGESE